jgi:hypothetical protein
LEITWKCCWNINGGESILKGKLKLKVVSTKLLKVDEAKMTSCT